MSLTKKHYIKLAELLGKHRADIKIGCDNNHLISDLVEYLKEDNFKFDAHTFLNKIDQVQKEIELGRRN